MTMNILDSFAESRRAYRAEYAKNVQGEPYCAEHDYVLQERDYGCRQCMDRAEAKRKAEAIRESRINDISSSFHTSCCRVGGLGGLPFWKWARFENEEWTKRCDPRVIAGVRPWDMTTSIAVFSGTGGGKTSAFVAKAHELNANALAAAEHGRTKPPPKFMYATGYDLAESRKCRRLGQDEHEFMTAAMKVPLLIFDEIHPSHTPADVVFVVLDARERAGLPTALGSGMSPADFGAAYGAAALRRALEGGQLVDAFAKSAAAQGGAR